MSSASTEPETDQELSAEPQAEREEDDQAVTPLELFFDLVFVLAITQVTSLLAADPTAHGLVRGVLMLALLWWGWVGYAWLTNTVNVDEGVVRLAYLAAMAAMLVASLAVPTAYTNDAMVFAVAYFVFRGLHVVIYERSTRDRPDVNRAIRQLGPLMLLSAALIVVGALFDGAAQIAIWAVAIALDYASPAIRGADDWSVSPEHFAERHGLIVIIALGESIVAIGAGVTSPELDAQTIAAAVLGIAAVGALWWLYFDIVAIVAGRRLKAAPPLERNRLARDSYSYLHLPMIVGIVLLALGLKKTLGHPDETLKAVPAVALCGGVALYLLAHIAFRLRNVRSWAPRRVVAMLVMCALVPVALTVPALASVACVAGVLVVLITYEVVRFRELRASIRAVGD